MEENTSKECIAIYDIRGIQEYIFRTNALKEIIGASKIVENIMRDEFEKATQKIVGRQSNEVILEWDKERNYQFDTNPNTKIEVLYYGGGNLVAVFRSAMLCQEVSIEMAKNIMKNAYGLSLIYAYTEKTGDYQADWKHLKERLFEIKSVTPRNTPAGILPIVKYDRITGKPLSKRYGGKMVTYEAYQKLKKAEEIAQEDSIYLKEFDKMRTSEEEGLIAIVHIDGNRMGANIQEIMQNTKEYPEAVSKMRKISKTIYQVFEEKAIEEVKGKMGQICKKHNILIKNGKIPFRCVIQAGDDITFVCNERLALDLTKEYLLAIKKEKLWEEQYRFSACAGIAIIHSHFPFCKGYQIAEQCCKKAKERAKNEGSIDGKVGNFIDFQYCYSGSILDLEKARQQNYCNISGVSLLKRPYGIYDKGDGLTKEQQAFELNRFEKDLQLFAEISRGIAKDFRDAYYEDKATIETMFTRQAIKNQMKYRPPFVSINGKEYAEYFDALEMLDIFAGKEFEDEKETTNQTNE